MGHRPTPPSARPGKRQTPSHPVPAPRPTPTRPGTLKSDFLADRIGSVTATPAASAGPCGSVPFAVPRIGGLSDAGIGIARIARANAASNGSKPSASRSCRSANTTGSSRSLPSCVRWPSRTRPCYADSSSMPPPPRCSSSDASASPAELGITTLLHTWGQNLMVLLLAA